MRTLFASTNTVVLRPRVTPDTAQADLLEKKLRALSYRPMNGFHKDQWENRKAMPGATRLRVG